MKSCIRFTHKKAGRCQKAVFVVIMFTFPLFLGAWKIITDRDINPNYVERIKDGQTKKHEILTLFGDPEEINRTPEGLVYTYKSFRNKKTLPSRQEKGPKFAQDSMYHKENFNEKKSTPTSSAKEPESVLTIRFDKDGETVRSHHYKEF